MGKSYDNLILEENKYREKAKEWASQLKEPTTRLLAEEAAEIVLQQGFELPRLKPANLGGKTRLGLVLANFDATSNTISVNNNPAVKKAGGLIEAEKKAVEWGWHSQENPILHELAHYIDSVVNPNFNSIRREWEIDLDHKYVKKMLSEYAVTNYMEYEAELISGILKGKTYPKEIMEYSVLSKLDDRKAKLIFDMGNGKVADTAIKPGYVIKEELAFDELMRFVYKQRGISPELLKKAEAIAFTDTTASVLDQAMREGIRQTAPSAIMIQRLKESNYVFSGFKTFHEMKEAFPLMVDENGNRKPFKQFLKEVQTVNEKYNEHYLRAEYNFAVTSSEMAAKWEQFEEDGDRYDLQYRTVGDDRVRESHRKLDGVTLPPSSKFWDEYFPPNGWRCRCTVVQVRKGKYDTSNEHRAMEDGNQATGGKHAEMMRFNPGKRAACFPAYNPYTVSKCATCPKGNMKLAADIPSNELCSACKVIREMKKEDAKTAKVAAKPLQGFVVSNPDFPHEIKISGNTIKEWTNQPHKHFREKNRMLLDIKKVMKDAQYIGRTDNHKNAKRVVGSHIFETKLGGDKTWIIVREYDWGEMLLHSITDSESILNHIKQK